jgi:hypothetical protein
MRVPHMAKSKPVASAPRDKINAVLPVELIARIEEMIAALRRQGVKVNKSYFVEIATTELLARRDLADVLKKRAPAKRS